MVCWYKYHTKAISSFFTLLRSGLWEREIDEPSDFPLAESEWNTVYQMAIHQTVVGVVYRGILQLPDHLLPPDGVLVRWVAHMDAIERRNRRMNAVVNELCGVFSDKGIRAVLQKGQGIASLYVSPLMRECGDIDLYFPSAQERRQADEWVKQQGIKLNKGADGSVHYEWKGVTVEHHRRLFDLYNPFIQGYLGELERQYGFDQTEVPPGSHVSLTVASPQLNLLMLNAHILKHALGLGVGLRQLCDIARAYHAWHDQVNQSELTAMYAKAGIAKWSQLLHRVLVDYLGLPASCLPASCQLDPPRALSPLPLIRIILQGGNFGQAAIQRSQPQRHSQRKISTAQSFLQNAQFAFRYAPWESVGIVSTLLTGQTK